MDQSNTGTAKCLGSVAAESTHNPCELGCHVITNRIFSFISVNRIVQNKNPSLINHVLILV